MKQPISINALYEIYKLHPQVQTDTRKLQNDDLYFALKGPNFNGNEFAVKALEQGAAFSIVDEPIATSIDLQNRIIEVEDVLTTLQALAKFHRQQFKIPFIAITGSNGKTTTKELVTAVLSSHYKTYTTQGNLNNHIGVPLTLLSIKQDAAYAIIEMGANHLHEIESYCSYTLPTHGLINNCGKAHLEGFGSEEGVKKGKGELFDFIRINKGSVFINSDLDYLVSMSKGIENVISYGTYTGDLQGKETNQDGGLLQVTITHSSDKSLVNTSIKTNLVGAYNLPNVLAAINIGLYCKVPVKKIISAIENYLPNNSRSQLITWRNNQVILDAYNANPSSMKVAVENFANIQSNAKILCLGGMKELGDSSLEEHQLLINQINKYQFKQVLLVGKEFEKCTHTYSYFETTEAAKHWIDQQNFIDQYFLIKGSRGIQMEKLIAS